jgi:hypothetical protein
MMRGRELLELHFSPLHFNPALHPTKIAKRKEKGKFIRQLGFKLKPVKHSFRSN